LKKRKKVPKKENYNIEEGKRKVATERKRPLGKQGSDGKRASKRAARSIISAEERGAPNYDNRNQVGQRRLF